jgi:glutathione S-transferase
MKIYGVTMSPFVQRVITTCRIKGIDFELIRPEGGLKTPEFMAFSLNQRVPVIEEEDGWTMVESIAIVHYLEATHPTPAVIPADPRLAARARAIAMLCDIEIGPALLQYTRQPLLNRFSRPDVLAYSSEQLTHALDTIERLGVTGGRWALGDQISLADIALTPLLTLAQIIIDMSDAGDILSGRPEIDDYWARMQEEPIWADMLRDFRTGFEHMVKVGYATVAGNP